MKRLLPAPLLSVALFGLWLVLNGSAAPATLLMAALMAVAIPLLTARLRPRPVRRLSRPRVLLRFLSHVAVDVVRSNLEVARGVWHRPGHPPQGGFVRVPLELRDPSALAALAMVMCVIPGTVWCELSADRSVLLVHAFELHDEAELVERIRQRYERPLRELFE